MRIRNLHHVAASPAEKAAVPFWNTRSARRLIVSAGAALALAGGAHAQTPPASRSQTLTPAELFALADQARDSGNVTVAESAYRALADNPDTEVHTEARFRLAMLLAGRMGRLRDAAVELRRILDEKPKAARVRLELARIEAAMGDSRAALREFRAAQAAGLPPQVERLVRFYANALTARKRLGGSLELTLAPDSNINHATRSDALETAIGNFYLSPDARAQSGVGLAMRGQAYARIGLQPKTDLLVRVLGNGNFYRASQFDDYAVSVQAGPEYNLGPDRLTLSLGPVWRWYGRQPYSTSVIGDASWQHPVGKRAQARIDATIGHVHNLRNALQDATDYTLSASLDRAFSARMGGGIQLFGARETARDPGYSTLAGGANLYAFREFGHTTGVITLGYSHLAADERLFLGPLIFPRRIDDRYSASLAATFRSLRIGSFAPLVRVRWERNHSTVELYDYSRFTGEFGITSAF